MKLLELFAGTRSIGKEAEKLGFKVFSVDIKPFENINYSTDILNFDFKKVPFKPQVIWASPPCTTFSVMSLGRYWTRSGKPKNEKAALNLQYVSKTIEIINFFKPKFWFIENPRGKLRKLHVLNPLGQWPNFNRQTVTYCKYGWEIMKPTDIFNNCQAWQPVKHCKSGDTCHQPSPRGNSKSGLQSIHNRQQRSAIPPQLCKEILNAVKSNF